MIKVSELSEVLHRIRTVLPRAELYTRQEGRFHPTCGPTQTIYELEVHTPDGQLHTACMITYDDTRVPMKVIGKELVSLMTSHLYNI